MCLCGSKGRIILFHSGVSFSMFENFVATATVHGFRLGLARALGCNDCRLGLVIGIVV